MILNPGELTLKHVMDAKCVARLSDRGGKLVDLVRNGHGGVNLYADNIYLKP